MHSPVQGGQSTDMRGVVVDALAVSFGASGAPTLVDEGKSGLLDATSPVVRTAQGRYTFQLSKNYYASVVAVLPKLSCVDAAGAILHARYVEGSYSASAGTFEVDVTDNAGVPAAADPTSATSLSLLIVFQKYTNL